MGKLHWNANIIKETMWEGVWFPMAERNFHQIEFWSIKYKKEKIRRADSPSCVFTPRVDVKQVLMDTCCSKTS